MATQSKKILIIEDDKDLLHILSETFKRERFTVLEAPDGEEGLKMALENRPDLILLDLILPRMDGLTMLEKFREDEVGKNTPVIILTNLGNAEDVSRAIKSGAYDFLVKSDWKLEELVAKVKGKLGIS